MEPCSQIEQINNLSRQTERQNRALFGNPDDQNDLGAIELIKEIHASQLTMKPTFNEITNWATFFQKGRQVGIGIVLIITIAGAIFGAIYTVRSWIRGD